MRNDAIRIWVNALNIIINEVRFPEDKRRFTQEDMDLAKSMLREVEGNGWVTDAQTEKIQRLMLKS